MKLISLLFLSMLAHAHGQLGAKAERVTIINPAGTPTILSNCTVTKIEPDGVRVSHDSGFAKVPYEMLPEAWRTAVQIDEKTAKEFREKTSTESRESLQRAEQEIARQAEESAAKREDAANRKRPISKAPAWTDAAAEKKRFQILKVEVLSVLPQGLLVDQLEPAPPRADSMASVGGGGFVASGGYKRSGTKLLLTGKLPRNAVDGMIFSTQAENTGTMQLGSESDKQATIAVYNSIAHDSKE